MTSRRAYQTDLSDARWALIEPILTEWRAGRTGLGIKEPIHDLREIVNAIQWMNRAGCAWHLLPHDFPPYKTSAAWTSASPGYSSLRPQCVFIAIRLSEFGEHQESIGICGDLGLRGGCLRYTWRLRVAFC